MKTSFGWNWPLALALTAFSLALSSAPVGAQGLLSLLEAEVTIDRLRETEEILATLPPLDSMTNRGRFGEGEARKAGKKIRWFTKEQCLKAFPTALGVTEFDGDRPVKIAIVKGPEFLKRVASFLGKPVAALDQCAAKDRYVLITIHEAHRASGWSDAKVKNFDKIYWCGLMSDDPKYAIGMPSYSDAKKWKDEFERKAFGAALMDL